MRGCFHKISVRRIPESPYGISCLCRNRKTCIFVRMDVAFRWNKDIWQTLLREKCKFRSKALKEVSLILRENNVDRRAEEGGTRTSRNGDMHISEKAPLFGRED